MSRHSSSRSSKHISKSKSGSRKEKNTYSPEVLNTFCPRCGRGKGKVCISFKAEGGDRPKPHDQRVNAAQKKAKVHINIDDLPEEDNGSKKKVEKDPKAKLTADQKIIVEKIEDKFSAIGIDADYIGPVTIGPYITTYRFRPSRKTKVKKMEQAGGDLAVALGRESTLVKMMPGDSAVGVFVPNEKKERIDFKDTLPNVMKFMHEPTDDGHTPIPMNFGMDHTGKPFVDDLTTQPHILMAGTTGAGKSTGSRALILSMIFALSPDKLKLIISDTKGVEFKAFREVPHLVKFPTGQNGYCNNVYDTLRALDWAVKETQNRYDKMNELFNKGIDVQNIHQYNAKVPEYLQMPMVVIVIDELADLVSNDQSRAEATAASNKLKTLCGRARAAGIYVIASTQRPDVKTVMGAIKVNFPGRVSFRLPSHKDSQTILGMTGAQHLITRGDMFYVSATKPELKRLHAPWTSTEDVKDILETVIANNQQASPNSEFKSSLDEND